MQQPNTNPEKQERGFTLIEIMAVVIIMGMLMGLVGLTVFQQVDKARQTTALAKIKQLESALEFYYMDNGRYPTSDQGLEALVNKPTSAPEPRNYPSQGYVKSMQALEDPWGEIFQYQNPGQHNQGTFDLWSLGADGAPGGEDVNEDLGNWDAQESRS